jgi:hypothetical protein
MGPVAAPPLPAALRGRRRHVPRLRLRPPARLRQPSLLKGVLHALAQAIVLHLLQKVLVITYEYKL